MAKQIKLEEVKLLYTSPAYPISDIKLNTSYLLGKDKGKYYIYNDSYKQEIALELVKSIFTPKDYQWKEISHLL